MLFNRTYDWNVYCKICFKMLTCIYLLYNLVFEMHS